MKPHSISSIGVVSTPLRRPEPVTRFLIQALRRDMDAKSEIEVRTTSLDPNTVFDLLSKQRRRYVLVCLSEHGSLALADLAEEVTRHERDAPIADIAEEDILRVYSSLWHAHIPKLAEAGVVAYDQDRDLVRLGENAITVETPSTDS